MEQGVGLAKLVCYTGITKIFADVAYYLLLFTMALLFADTVQPQWHVAECIVYAGDGGSSENSKIYAFKHCQVYALSSTYGYLQVLG